MSNFTYYPMPTYTRNHDGYCRQMMDWHVKMQQYREHLQAYHIEQVQHYRKLLGEKAGAPDNHNVA